MPESRKPDHHTVGEEGEKAAREYLHAQGYTVVASNVRNRYGEIDIIAKYQGTYHFVEVKTLSGRREHSRQDQYHPLDHLTSKKIHTLTKAIYEYRREYGILDTPCAFDAIAVWIDTTTREADIAYFPQVYFAV